MRYPTLLKALVISTLVALACLTARLQPHHKAKDPSLIKKAEAAQKKTAQAKKPPKSTDEQRYIVKKIKGVFRNDADKAFLLLEGDGKNANCPEGENHDLDPTLENTAGNSPEGSRDVGIFMVNQYWQGVDARFLHDPELNILIAYKIYKDSGYNFSLWTCGRAYGI